MMKKLIFLLAIFGSLSAFAETKPGITLVPNTTPFHIRIFCANDECDQISVEGIRVSSGALKDPSRVVGPFSLEQWIDTINNAKVSRNFFLTNGEEWPGYDPAAGGLNIFLPAIWLVGGTLMLGNDLIQLTPIPYFHTRSVKAKLEQQMKELTTDLKMKEGIRVDVKDVSMDKMIKIFGFSDLY